jgi:hypothetical protein
MRKHKAELRKAERAGVKVETASELEEATADLMRGRR